MTRRTERLAEEIREEVASIIARRLKDRIMFGGDYPLFTYERLVKEWREEGYSEEVLDKLFHRNAERFAQELGLKWT